MLRACRLNTPEGIRTVGKEWEAFSQQQLLQPPPPIAMGLNYHGVGA